MPKITDSDINAYLDSKNIRHDTIGRAYLPTNYIRTPLAIMGNAIESVENVAEAIATTTLTFWQRIVAFVRRVFGKIETVAA